LALEEAKNGITVNVVNPSSIDENELTLEEARKIHDARFPIGRPPTVEDVAAAVGFFASEEGRVRYRGRSSMSAAAGCFDLA